MGTPMKTLVEELGTVLSEAKWIHSAVMKRRTKGKKVPSWMRRVAKKIRVSGRKR